jgi:hypothetical protein
MAGEHTKPPYNQPSAVPAKYNWPTLLKKDNDDLFDHYRHMLESLGVVSRNFSSDTSWPLPYMQHYNSRCMVTGKEGISILNA